MKLLILGGTRFVGRHLVEAALAAGHAPTLFNRGQTAATLFPGLPALRGDRRVDLSALAHGEWDAVIDCCGYLPGEVERSAALLRERVGRYLFISSISAYAGFAAPNDETSPLGVLADPDTELVDGASYGPLKAACEQQVRRHFGEQRSLLIRPGLVVGPHDPTQRFSYWPARFALAADGGPLLLPGRPGDALQWIDARDLARFAIGALEAGRHGAFNVVSTPGQFSRGDLVEACMVASGRRPQAVWVDDARLLALGAKPWTELPLWLPAEGEFATLMRSANAKALAAGLRLRPMAQTVADTLAWWRGLPPQQQRFDKAGLSREREAQLLAAARR
ncbi:NAD-dependent epimerase/dehydratase family protein [Roseateles violae]|uniref:NAD-dependent epimerase/dehydratase family protein n=1 Tax=Roseateles violae TaxID=3058042 RepID=A0ABT8DU61_9BURK|nr:NAD-dependent epimerase/dehydratase family protein [Pelomonas sp. PFR6]MDN3921822.1 NAD-dependent epimerase/dehydratase family protein [Pelomonas sp. PFR6]